MQEAPGKLLEVLSGRCTEDQLAVVRHAYRFANEAHHDQTRASGEPYIIHGLEVAMILAEYGLDHITCAAGLLHDVVEDTHHPVERVRAEMGDEIGDLVEGVTKVSALSFSGETISREERETLSISKILVAAMKDQRIIFLKFADRLHNMRTLEHLNAEAQCRIARETLNIYVPLANCMGVFEWEKELEELSFKFLMLST
ncbi:MAG: HD domain-containing protein [Candidatus Hydrogenedens sp.]|jgi:GTP pyrophosphokinase|nr:HD domain-containing protein [Candidatus Hydrogenedens sp.]